MAHRVVLRAASRLFLSPASRGLGSNSGLLIRRTPTSLVSARFLAATTTPKPKKPASSPLQVAVVLSGCGVNDGSEIHEAVSILVHLGKNNCVPTCFAPDMDQYHAINHVTGNPMEETRNVMVESARISRGQINPLVALDATGFDAIVFPGGFGAAKNLSTFAFEGQDCKIHEQVERVIRQFYDAKKPIGLCCISPVLVAKVLRNKVTVTVGHDTEEGGKWPYAGTAKAIESFGSRHVVKDLDAAHIDENSKVVTAAAYMCDAKPHEVFESVGRMIEGVVQLARK